MLNRFQTALVDMASRALSALAFSLVTILALFIAAVHLGFFLAVFAFVALGVGALSLVTRFRCGRVGNPQGRHSRRPR